MTKQMATNIDKQKSEEIIRARQEWLRELILGVDIDKSYTYNDSGLIADRVAYLVANCVSILDVGKSSRSCFDLYKPGQVTTLDINRFEDYPDIIDDLCDPMHLDDEEFDGLVCLSVIEHVYEPQAAIDTLYRCLKPGGVAFVHVPFVFRYHAPQDLYFQDYYRFTRDGVAYLFRNFEKITLYPVRGRLSSSMNLQRFWKKRVERRFGHRVNQWIDRIYDRIAHRSAAELQTSGYFIWAQKPIVKKAA